VDQGIMEVNTGRFACGASLLLGLLTARDEADAVKCVAKGRPDVIVLDRTPPSSSGWEFADGYQSGSGGQVLPSIVVSATPYPNAASVGSGQIQRCLAKPFDTEELARAMGDLTGQKARADTGVTVPVP